MIETRRTRRRAILPARGADIVFRPALAPLEASVLPAKEKRPKGALRHAREAFRLPGEPEPRRRGGR